MPEYSIDGITALKLGARNKGAAGGGQGRGNSFGPAGPAGPAARVVQVSATEAKLVVGDSYSSGLRGADESFFSTDGKTAGM